MALLSGGVPLSLLIDLVFGPRSEELLTQERSAQPCDPRD
jgi:hypothetical protein